MRQAGGADISVRPSRTEWWEFSKIHLRTARMAECSPMAAALATAYQLPPEEPDDLDGKMGFLEHLDELRKRLIRSCLAVAAGMLIAFFFINHIVTFVLGPARRMLPPRTVFIYTNPSEA